MKVTIEGHSTIIESVSFEDAQIICDLRNQPQINQYLSSSNVLTLEDQIKWQTANADKKDGLYLKIIDKKTNDCCGTISIYEISDDGYGELGRYICTKSLQAIEAELLLIKFSFEVMRLKLIYCRTAELNTKVWKQHYEYGFEDNEYEFFIEKNLNLKKQTLSLEKFKIFDYSKIETIIKRMS